MSIVVPSHVKSVVELLRGNATRVHPGVAALVTTLQTLVGNRVDTEWLPAWDKPDGKICSAITIRSDGGFGTSADRMGVRSQGRVFIRCWSTTYHVANQMAQLLQQILDPINPAWTGWVAANTNVDDLTGISEPLQYQEPGRKYKLSMDMAATLWYRRIAVTP